MGIAEPVIGRDPVAPPIVRSYAARYPNSPFPGT